MKVINGFQVNSLNNNNIYNFFFNKQFNLKMCHFKLFVGWKGFEFLIMKINIIFYWMFFACHYVEYFYHHKHSLDNLELLVL